MSLNWFRNVGKGAAPGPAVPAPSSSLTPPPEPLSPAVSAEDEIITATFALAALWEDASLFITPASLSSSAPADDDAATAAGAAVVPATPPVVAQLAWFAVDPWQRDPCLICHGNCSGLERVTVLGDEFRGGMCRWSYALSLGDAAAAAWITPKVSRAFLSGGVPLAAQSGNVGVLRALLGCLRPSELAYSASLGLHAAAEHRNAACVRELCEAGANVAFRGCDGNEPLHTAAKFDAFDAMRVLLDAGASLYSIDHFGGTALHTAAAHGSTACAQLLLSRGARHDTVDTRGATPLFHAAKASLPMLQLLLGAGAHAGARDHMDQTALDRAVLDGRSDTVAMLLAAGCPPTGSPHTTPPLLVAARNDHVEILAALLAAGAPIHSRGRLGMTALHVAVKAGSARAVQLLLDRGAIPALGNAEGRSAFDLAEDGSVASLATLPLLEAASSG